MFVSGLPMDAKPRELYLLFRAYEVSPDLSSRKVEQCLDTLVAEKKKRKKKD